MAINDQYAYLLVSNNPDNKIEYFWYYYKQVIINYLDTVIKNDITIVILNRVDKLSKHFNKLQEKQRYSDIESIIRQFILISPFIVLPVYFINNCSEKYIRFLNLWKTHIKRWNLICTYILQINLNPNQLKYCEDKLEKYIVIYTTLIRDYHEFINANILDDLDIVIDNIDLYVSFIIKPEFYIKIYNILLSSIQKLYNNKEIGILEYIYVELNIINIWINNVYTTDIERFNKIDSKLLSDSKKTNCQLSLTKFFKLYNHLISSSDFVIKQF